MSKKIRFGHLLSKSPAIDNFWLSFLANICTAGISLFEHSYPITKIITPAAQRCLDENKPLILSIYHGRIIGMLHIVKDRSKVTILISRSRDGEMIARIAQKIGFSVARGSPSFQAVEGALQLVAAAKSGQSLMLTVDGPRGPIYKVKPGVIRIAQLTGLPLLPFFCSFKSGHTMRKSWDKISGGYYGTPMLYVIGDPLYVPANATTSEREILRQKLETAMDSLRAQSDEYWQSKHITPV